MNSLPLRLRPYYELLVTRFPWLRRQPARRRRTMEVQLELPLGPDRR